MAHSRRSLVLGSSAALAALAGCRGLGLGNRPQLGLTLRNYTDTGQPLQLTLLGATDDTHEGAVVLEEEFTVPAPEGGDAAGTIRRSDVVPARRYLVRVLLRNGPFDRFHAHYYPEDSTPAAIDLAIRRTEPAGKLSVDFRGLS